MEGSGQAVAARRRRRRAIFRLPLRQAPWSSACAFVAAVLVCCLPPHGLTASRRSDPWPSQLPLEGYRLVETWTGRQAADDVPRLVRSGGLASAADDTLFAVDSGAGAVYHLTSGGRRLGVWRVDATVGEPQDVAVGGDRVYVVGDAGGEVRSPTGALLGKMPTGDAFAVSIGPDGQVYTLERRAGQPQKNVVGVYSLDGVPIETWPTALSSLHTPRRLEVGRDGRLYVAADGVVNVLSRAAPSGGPPDGRLVAQLKPQGHLVGPELLDLIVIDDEVFGLQSGTVIAWALGADWAPEIDPRGRIVRSRSAGVIAVVEGAAVSIAAGPGSSLIIALSRPTAQVLARVDDRDNMAGELSLTHLDAQDLLGQLEAPRRVSLSLAGGAFVLDSLARVQLWLDGGIPSAQWLIDAAPVDVAGGEDPCVVFTHQIVCLTGVGSGAAPVEVPDSWLVAADGNATRLVALDVVSQRLRVFDRSVRPRLLASWPLAAYGGYYVGGDVAVDDSQVFVADRMTQQVDVWGLDGTVRPPISAVSGTPIRVAAKAGLLYVLTAEGWLWKVDLATSAVKAVWRLPDGTTPTDIAASGKGRVYVTDARAGRVLVFDPGGPPETALPSRPKPRCRVELARSVSRQPACPNEDLYVRLVVRGGCPPEEGPVDVVIAFDTSTSMSGYALGEAQAAAVEFLAGLKANGSQVAVVSFGDTAEVVANLSDDPRAALWSISHLRLSGHTSVLAGLQAAEAELAGPRARSASGRAVLVLTDGQSPDAGVNAVVDRLVAGGTSVFFVGVGEAAAADGLARLAGGTGQAFLRPGPSELAAVAGTLQAYRQPATLLLRGTLALDLPAGTEPLPGSVKPPAARVGNRLVWSLKETPPDASFVYALRPAAHTEILPLGGATLAYTDTLALAGETSAPALGLDVAAECRRSLYIPRAGR